MKHYIVMFLIMTGFSSLLFAEGLSLESKDMKGQLSLNEVFDGFGCTGKNISPELSWDNAPEGTKSFALTVYDPDAPTGSGWWHWLVLNIPKDVTSLQAGAGDKSNKLIPTGSVQNINDYGFAGFGGACPPKGDISHQYIFTVHALDVERLSLDGKQSAAIAGYNINVHTIQKASLIVYYGH